MPKKQQDVRRAQLQEDQEEDDPDPEGNNEEYEEGVEEIEGVEEYAPDFYENLEIISEHESVQTGVGSQQTSKKGKPRSLSFDSDSSDASKKPNVKCGSCKKPSILEKNQKIIRCPHCGYRILFKLRTRNYITFKTE